MFGVRHMNHLAHEIVAYYHEARPHQIKDNDLLVPAADAKKAEEPGVVRLSDIRCRKRLGGLLKHYYRKAALGRLLCLASKPSHPAALRGVEMLLQSSAGGPKHGNYGTR